MRLRIMVAGVTLAAFAAASQAAAPSMGSSGPNVSNFLDGQDAQIVWVHDDGTDSSVWQISTTSWTAAKVNNTVGAESPLISPDGTDVVFSTRTGAMKIVELGSGTVTNLETSGAWSPHWYTDPSDGLCIIYTDQDSIALDSSLGSTFKRTVPGGTITTLWAGRAMDAGMSPDGRFLGESYDLNYTVDFGVGGAGAGALDAWGWYQAVGAYQDWRTCNGSMSPDDGLNWGMMSLKLPHVYFRIFRYDTTKARWTVEKTYASPAAYYEWQHTEWSNHPDFAIATAGNINSDHYVHLIKTAVCTDDEANGVLKITNSHADWPHMRVFSTSPYLLLQPGELAFSAVVNDATAAAMMRTITISNSAGGAFGAVAIDNAGGEPAWLSTSALSGSGDDRTFTVTVDPTDASVSTAATYTWDIQVSAGGATNTARILTVTLEVLADTAGLDSDGDGVDNAAEAAAGTDPLDAWSIPSSDGGNGGCAAEGTGAPFAFLALVAALGVFALTRKSRVALKVATGVAACLLVVSALTACGNGNGGPSYAMTLTIVRVSDAVTDTVTLDWTATTTAESYNVYRADDGGAAVVIAAPAVGTITYDDTTVVPGVKYDYYVAEVVGGADAGLSNPVTADYLKLLSPVGGETWSKDTTQAITWETNVPAGDYQILCSLDGGATYPHDLYFSNAPNGFGWLVGWKASATPTITYNTTDFITPSETQVRIRVQWYSNNVPHMSDESTADFSVVP